MTASAPEPFRVLLVDQDGVGAAPAGERFLRHELAARGIDGTLIRVESAGLDAVDGRDMAPVVRDALARNGVDAMGYRSRRLTSRLLHDVDIVICGDSRHRDQVDERFPHAARRAFSLSEIFYLYEHIVAIAPLREHPALLAGRADSAHVPRDFDLPATGDIAQHIDALVQQIQRSALWMAAIWESMLPAGPDAPPSPAREDVTVDLLAFGVTVRVVCHGDVPFSLGTKVRLRWERLLAPAPHHEPDVTISLAVIEDRDAANQARHDGWLVYDSIDTAMHFLSSTVTVRAIDARAGELVMLHAAGLSDADGNVVAFVAPSGTGKTTLARTLGQHYGYVTDETLAVEFDGTVLPYPKPLSVIVDHASALKDQQSAYDLELLEPPSALRLARIVVLDRRGDAPVTPGLEHLPLLHGMAELAEQTSYLTRLPRLLHTLADLVESVGGVWRLTYRESADIEAVFPALAAGAEL